MGKLRIVVHQSLTGSDDCMDALYGACECLERICEDFRCSFGVARNTVIDTATEILGRTVRSYRVGGVAGQAQKEATALYNKNAYDRIEIKVKKGQKGKIVKYIKQQGKSVNQFIVDLIDKEMLGTKWTGD